MEKKGFDAKTQWITQKWERTEEKNTVIYVNVKIFRAFYTIVLFLSPRYKRDL